MFKKTLILLIVLFMFGCGDLSNGTNDDSSETLFSPCQESNELCKKYFQIWKNQIQKRNVMKKEYFNEHIIPVNAYLYILRSGEMFRVDYKIQIDWAEIDNPDQFQVMMKSSETAYQQLSIPRDVYLSEEKIELVLNSVYGSSITPIISIDKLKYSSQNEALKALQDIANTDKIKFNRISYYVPGKLPREDGYPYLFGSGEISLEDNKCIEGYLNLVTGQANVYENACYIIN